MQHFRGFITLLMHLTVFNQSSWTVGDKLNQKQHSSCLCLILSLESLLTPLLLYLLPLSKFNEH